MLASVALISAKSYYTETSRIARVAEASDRTIDFTEKREIMEDEREEN